ncbi:cobalamin B12-binding domain-containing protein [Fulvimarina sp. MAC8]|uniref:cobalamin B12-binding domain-containing protein n=1 Tax=Fulvimarina sp. MAC8 TaxID=3162874 RepID=UPI0032ED6DD5
MAYFANGAQLSRPAREGGKHSIASTDIDTSDTGAKTEKDRSRKTIEIGDLHVEKGGREGACRSLEDAVRQAVIPRLYAQRMRHAEEPPERTPFEDRAQAIIANGAVDQLLRLVLSGQTSAQEAFFNDLHEQAVPVRALIEDIVVPVANEIGSAWVEDRMSFAEVTLKIGLMQTAVSNFTSKTLSIASRHNAPRFLVSPVPGEQHVFGSAVLSSLLIAQGYRADAILDASPRKLCEQVEAYDYAAVGLSCNSDRTLPLVKGLIRDLRETSRNRSIAIMIGGWALQEDNESLHTLGADLVVTKDRNAMDAIVERFELGF